MKKLISEVKFQVQYYASAVKRAVTYYIKNLGAAIIGRNILDKVNVELQEVLMEFASENAKLSAELQKIAKSKPKKTTKRKEK